MSTTAAAPTSARRCPPDRASYRIDGSRDETHVAVGRDDVLVACPDARTPAYQAAVGLARAGRLGCFATAFYYAGDGRFSALRDGLAPRLFARYERLMRRRHEPEIPVRRVRSDWGFDLALAAERRLAVHHPRARLRLARWRTRWFDRTVERSVIRDRPGTALFSATSPRNLPCRRVGGSGFRRCSRWSTATSARSGG